MICKRFALVGSGFIGQVHAASLARHEGSALTMVADAAPERAQALAARYGARAVTVSEALHSDAIDAVLIASSTPSHAELLEAAARAGKAVYCEKPIDLSLARAREVVERVLPLNVPVTVGFNRRFDSSHQQLRRQLEQGAIGRVELVQMVCRASSMPPLDYLRSSGGQMRDQAIHFFDLLRFLTGDEVRTVAAMGAALALPDIAEFGDVDTSILMMQMRGGALAQLDNTRRTGHGYDERITLLGAEGALESGSQSPAGPTLWRGNQRIEPGLWPDWFSRVQGSYYQHLDAFIRSLNGETVADLPGLLDGLQAQAIAEAAVQSLQHGPFVAVDRRAACGQPLSGAVPAFYAGRRRCSRPTEDGICIDIPGRNARPINQSALISQARASDPARRARGARSRFMPCPAYITQHYQVAVKS